MCDTCGCGPTQTHTHARATVVLHSSLLAHNDTGAAHLRAHFAAAGTATINLMGSPGSGKTALLEALAAHFAASPERPRCAAVSGDLATENDAVRLRRAGLPSVGIATGTGCHLDAAMLHEALHRPELAAALDGARYFFVENVGNLVCPALFDLGQVANLVLLSVTEGVDKPEKYPVMFRGADRVLLTKADLLPHLPEVEVEAVRRSLARVAPGVPLLPVSARTGQGIAEVAAWLSGLDPRRFPGDKPSTRSPT